jgi:hypothetical protein
MQHLECRNDIPQVDSVDIRSKQTVNHYDLWRPTILAEPVCRAQHVRDLQRRAHGGEGDRHILA